MLYQLSVVREDGSSHAEAASRYLNIVNTHNASCIKYHKSNQGIEDEGEIKREIDFMLETLGIEEKRHERSMSLSGGMKRKLR